MTELDLGKLKGDLRQIGWSSDGTELYVQTADGHPPSEMLRHYTVAVAGGPVKSIDRQPEWAQAFWEFKSDRFAPGIGWLMIDAERKVETIKSGTGQAGALDREASPIGGNLGNIDSIAKANDQNQKATVWRLKMFGETVSEFVNERPIPGLMFSWGPTGSAAIAYTTLDGRLVLLDQRTHKQTVSGAKDARLPAWSIDGTRMAWVQKSGRKKYTLVWATVTKG